MISKPSYFHILSYHQHINPRSKTETTKQQKTQKKQTKTMACIQRYNLVRKTIEITSYSCIFNIFQTIKAISFVCLWFFIPERIFHSYGDVTITGEGLQILTYARHSWPLSSDGSLACHTYCEGRGGHPFIMVISEYP